MLRRYEATERSRIENPLVKALEKRNETHKHKVWSTKLSGNPFQERGLPDRLLCYRGLFIMFELKRRPGMTGSRIQEVTMRDVRLAGGIAKVPHTLDEALRVLDAIDAYEDGTITWKQFQKEVLPRHKKDTL